jgi:hypothetical protein
MFITRELPMNKTLNNFIGLVFLAILILPGFLMAQDGIIINLKQVPNPWADSRLGEKLDLLLSTISNVSITRAVGSIDNSSVPIQTAAIDKLIEFGQAHNGRFLIDVFIDRIDLEKKKTVVLPCAVSRYQVYGTAIGVIRIIDIKKARVVDLVKMDCSLKAIDRWQFVDDDPNDGDLNMAPDKKIILFDSLEDKVAEKIFDEINKLSKGNHFGG